MKVTAILSENSSETETVLRHQYVVSAGFIYQFYIEVIRFLIIFETYLLELLIFYTVYYFCVDS
jgi:hypothetical protein